MNATKGRGFAVMSEEEREAFAAELDGLLRRVAGMVRRRGRAALTDAGVTLLEFDALVHVDGAGPVAIGDLGARLGLAYSTTTDLAQRMEQRRYVARERDCADKRIVRVRILPEGRAVLAKVLEARRRFLAQAVVLEEIESERIIGALKLLEDRLTHA